MQLSRRLSFLAAALVALAAVCAVLAGIAAAAGAPAPDPAPSAVKHQQPAAPATKPAPAPSSTPQPVTSTPPRSPLTPAPVTQTTPTRTVTPPKAKAKPKTAAHKVRKRVHRAVKKPAPPPPPPVTLTVPVAPTPTRASAPAHAAAGATTADWIARGLAARLDLAVSRTTRELATVPYARRRIAGIDVLSLTRDTTIPVLHQVAPDAVREVRPGSWEVDVTVIVHGGATLSIRAPLVRELRLLSTPKVFTSIVARSGSLEFLGRKGAPLLVRSWDPARGRPDGVIGDGRASVSARLDGGLYASNTTFANLGFWQGRVSGVAADGGVAPAGAGLAPTARRPVLRARGIVVHSTFFRNYFGAYSGEAEGMQWVDDRFIYNRVYGLDPHSASNDAVIRGNYAAHNGHHGIILSRFCDGNLIEDNISEHNGWHGIVIDDGRHGLTALGPSDSNRLLRNVVRSNAKVGISIDGSDRNIVRDNVVSGGRIGIRVFGDARENGLVSNRIEHVATEAIFIDFPSRSTHVIGDRVDDAVDGIRIRGATSSIVLGNTVVDARSHGVKVDGRGSADAAGTVIEHNSLSGHGPSPTSIKVARNLIRVADNTGGWDYPWRHDLARALGWFVGPLFWALLFLVIFAGRLIIGGSRWRQKRLLPAPETQREA